jgi:membrane-bound ClpP family serine protease
MFQTIRPLVFPLLLTLALAASESEAQEQSGSVAIEPNGTDLKIVLNGVIDGKVLLQFRAVMADPRWNRQRSTWVELNSPGGDVVAAEEIGKMIRKRSFWTAVFD